jgi:acetoacetate decarboxylase
METPNPASFLPYPLPPWEHDFKNLSVFCEVEESILEPLIPAPLTLTSNVVQFAVMYFACTVPTRPYFDAACMAAVRYKEVTGGFWFHAYTSTDQVMAGTREIWGYNMKLSDMTLTEGEDEVTGETRRLGKTIMSLKMAPSDKGFELPVMLPRIFLKLVPDAGSADGVVSQVVVMDTKPETTVRRTGCGWLSCEPSDDDPLHRLEPKAIIGASFTAGHQILPWGRVID